MKTIILVYSISISYRGYNCYYNTKLNSNSSNWIYHKFFTYEDIAAAPTFRFTSEYSGSDNDILVTINHKAILDLPEKWNVLYVYSPKWGFAVIVNGAAFSAIGNFYIENNKLIMIVPSRAFGLNRKYTQCDVYIS